MIDAQRAARSLESTGPDQYPTGFYEGLVEQKIAEGIDWQKKFKHLYEATCAAETPEGSQVDNILRAFLVDYHIAKSGD